MSVGVGPFFYFRGKIIADVTPLSEAETVVNKLTTSLSHSDLYDRIIKYGEYMLIPRGRVVWDLLKTEGIVYIDRCLDAPNIIGEVCRVFGLTDYRVEYDNHYICPKCKPRSFAHLM